MDSPSPSENGSAKVPNRKSSTSTLLHAFRNLTTRSFSSTQSPPLHAVSTSASLAATTSERDTLWSSHIGTSTDRTSGFDSTRQSVPATQDFPLLVGASAELNALYFRLQPGKPLPGRISAALDVCAFLDKQKVKEVIPLWEAGKDLVNDASVDAVEAGLKLLISCIKAVELSLLEKALFWDYLLAYEKSDQLALRLEALKVLTDSGRNIEGLQPALPTYIAKITQEAFVKAAAVRKKHHKSKGDPSSSAEQNLSNIFQFTTAVVRFNSITLNDEHLGIIIKQLVSVCRSTTSKVDVTNATNVMSAMATFTNISSTTFEPCIELLCQIYCQIDSLKDQTWSFFKLLFHSNLKNDAISILFGILQVSDGEAPKSSADTFTVQGAFFILRKLTLDNGMDGLPDISLATFATAVDISLERIKDPSYTLDVLRFYECVLDEPILQNRLVVDIDWVYFIRSLEKCYMTWAGSSIRDEYSSKSNGSANGSSKQDVDNRSEKYRSQSMQIFNDIIDKLCLAFDDLNVIHQDEAIKLFLRLGDDLNNQGMKVLLSHLESRPILMPPSFGTPAQVWQHVAVHVAQNISRPSALRMEAYAYLIKRFEGVRHLPDDEIEAYTSLVLQKMDIEEDPAVMEMLASFAAMLLATNLRDLLFDSVIAKVRAAVFNHLSKMTPAGSRRPSVGLIIPERTSQPSLRRLVVRHVIRLFLTVMNQSGHHADALFHFILDVAGTDRLDADARICALKLLFRIRCTSDHRIFIRATSESESIAAVVCRTIDTVVLAQPLSDATRDHRNASTGQIPSTGTKKGLNLVKSIPPLWYYPGPKALPQEPSETPSLVLYAQFPDKEHIAHITTLPINIWLESVIHILQQPNPDWEIYSYTLVHLGAQLKNKALFDGTSKQIGLLRNIICHQIRSSSFQTPPGYTSLKKADVAICLFHILTMLIGYNEHFAKSEVDDIVKMFILGIGSWDGTSKWCIHALSLCCHEIPLSVSKSLGDILLKMSQIITQQKIAMHILEFLCSLARLPEIYKNCTEHEYRMLFAVSFRYLEWARHQRQKSEETTNTLSPPTVKGNKRYSDSIRELKVPTEPDDPQKDKLDADLPQYVYALAYHVITFWFMALKLQDRPLFMQLIAKNLMYEESPGKFVIEDQGMVTLDMMERIAYSDRDETAYSPDFAKPTDGEIQKQTWIVGMSLLTIETAGRSGLSQLIRRRPVCPSSSLRLEF
jgi:uncharacterized protein DUF3384/tuberin